ncbi:MAG: VC_2705 family sodium/solute symporter, partial [Myxococcota bacterium]
AVASFARMNLIQTVDGREYNEVPEWFNSWERTGLIEFDDKNGDGKIAFVGDADKNELKVDRDIIVLANPEIAGLPNWVIALVAAGGLAAALSTAAGLLLVISSSISHDLLKSFLWKDLDDKQELMAARIAAAFAVVVAGYFGINPPGYVAQVVAFAFGLAAASFFPVLVLGVFDKRTNRQGAIAGMLIGIFFTGGYIVYFKFFGGVESEWLWGISPEGIGSIGMLINFVVTLVVSRITPPPPQHVVDLVDEMRLPREAPVAS